MSLLSQLLWYEVDLIADITLCVISWLVAAVQSLSRVWLLVTLTLCPKPAGRQASLSITNSWSLLKLMSIHSVMPSNHLILCCPLLLLPSIFPSIRVFSIQSVLRIRWPKYWSFSFGISPSNDYSGLIAFRMDWMDLLTIQAILKSLLQHYSSKASILWCSAFFIVQLSHPYMTTGKTIALTKWTFVGKVMSLLSNMLSRLVIVFLPRSKRLLISWLQSPSAVNLEPHKIKSDTVSTVSPFVCHEVMGPDAMIFVFWTLSFKPTFSLSSFTFIKRLFSSLLSAIRVVSSAYLRLLIFLPAILIPTCASISQSFLNSCPLSWWQAICKSSDSGALWSPVRSSGKPPVRTGMRTDRWAPQDRGADAADSPPSRQLKVKKLFSNWASPGLYFIYIFLENWLVHLGIHFFLARLLSVATYDEFTLPSFSL